MDMMMKWLFVAFVLPLLMLSTSHASYSQAPQGALVINFNTSVDQGSANYVAQAATSAISQHYDLVIVMNTPGGELQDMLSIVGSIEHVEQSGLNVYTYVPADGLAASAGSYIAIATDAIYMANGSFIGPSTPYVVGGSSSEQQHVQNAMIAYMDSLASEHGYNVSAAVNMAANNTAYTATEAARIGLITGMAQNFSSFLLLAGIQGLKLHYFYEPAYDLFLSFLSNSIVDGILLLVGFVAAAIDLLHRTVVLTAVAAVLIVLGFLGAEAIGAPVVAILLIVIAAILIFLEVKAGHGIFVTAGVAIGLVGVWMLAANAQGYSPSPYGLTTYLGLAAVGGFLIIGFIYLAKLREAIMRQPKAIDYERLAGKEGYASTEISPGAFGVCLVGAEEWTCTSNAFVRKGAKIRVVKFLNGILVVEEAK